jgi:hypothetical protein
MTNSLFLKSETVFLVCLANKSSGNVTPHKSSVALVERISERRVVQICILQFEGFSSCLFFNCLLRVELPSHRPPDLPHGHPRSTLDDPTHLGTRSDTITFQLPLRNVARSSPGPPLIRSNSETNLTQRISLTTRRVAAHWETLPCCSYGQPWGYWCSVLAPPTPNSRTVRLSGRSDILS